MSFKNFLKNFFCDISERNNDYSDTLDFRREIKMKPQPNYKDNLLKHKNGWKNGGSKPIGTRKGVHTTFAMCKNTCQQ